MRAGGCTVQQALTPEAASVVKQAVNLARRRGHAQVTPLHVANAMLSSPTGLLRAACLQSHSHPFQCKALELCFNVALNRLPAAAAPMLGPHHHHHQHPLSLANALVAAFKRAQAHQRRGSIESQQQPLLAVKIELEQLIISILDDPSVSRVMREAGFSSTQVKSSVEQAVNLDNNNNNNKNPPSTKETTTTTDITATAIIPSSSPAKSKPLDQVFPEDVDSIVETLSGRRKRSLVVVGECLATAESVVRAVMEKIDKGQVQDDTLRNVQFISLPIFSFTQLTRDEVEQKLSELQCLVKRCCVGMRGAVLYLGDLQWAAEYRASKWFAGSEKGSRGFYCPVEHVIMEIGRIIYSAGLVAAGEGSSVSAARFWLMGVATYQTYMKCRAGHTSLESVWGLHPITIPTGSLGLSLTTCDSTDGLNNKRSKSKKSGDGAFWTTLQLEDDDGINETNHTLACCPDCSVRFKSEVRDLGQSKNNCSSSSHGSLPSWLQHYKDETIRSSSNNEQEQCMSVKDLCQKWNSLCSSLHPERSRSSTNMTINPIQFISSASPSSSSFSSFNQSPWAPLPISVRPPSWRENNFWLASTETCDNHRSTNPNSSSSSDTMEMEYIQNKFKELNAENLKILINALEEKVPWQKEIIPEVASTVLQCRSGMMRRKERSTSTKEETWLFFHGSDGQGKEKIARELANLVFGSNSDNLVSIALSNFSSTRTGSSDDLRNKRTRSEAGQCYIERFLEALHDNPHRVIVMEDIEQVDLYSQTLIRSAIETGKVKSSGEKDEVSLSDSIIILSCESFDSRSRACSPPVKQKSSECEQDEIKQEEEDEEHGGKEANSSICLDLNVCANEQELIMTNYCSPDDVDLLESVDRAFFFKLPEDL